MENQKPRDRSETRKSPEKRLPPMGSNLVWYLIAIALLVLIVVMLFKQEAADEISYSKLEELVKLGPEPNQAKSVEIVRTSGKEEKRYKYWGLHEVKVGQFEVTGKVHRKTLGADANAKPDVVRFRTSTFAVQEEGAIGKLLSANRFDFAAEDPPSVWKSYSVLILLTVALIVFFLFVLRRIGGAGSPMAFGRSRGKLYAQEDIGVTFEDVAGVDEAVDELKEVVEFLRTPERYQVVGGRIPKGILLVGPPGTGKTLLAKAVAGEAGVPFFSLSGSDFVEMFVGVGAARVRDMFQQAEARSPCIIFIDELDALGKTRGTSIVGGHDEREQTLNALLVEMDGFDSNAGIIVLSATNRPETLDPALLRPGRFDRQVLVDRPDVRGREAILKVHAKNVKLDESVTLHEIAQMTPGFVGADLANLVNEAALLAGRKRKSSVGMEEFNEGVERVMAGLEKKQRVMHPEEKQRVAHHESGHALVAFSLPNTPPVRKVSIIPRGVAALGYTLQRPEEDRYLMTKGELDSHIAVLLAGTISEEIIYDEISTGAQNDLERATDIARRMVMEFGMSRLGRVNYRESQRPLFIPSTPQDLGAGRLYSEETMREIDQEVKRVIDEGLERARAILSARRPALEALSKRLMEKEVIDADELREIVETHSPGPWVVPGTSERRRAVETKSEEKTPIDVVESSGP